MINRISIIIHNELILFHGCNEKMYDIEVTPTCESWQIKKQNFLHGNRPFEGCRTMFCNNKTVRKNFFLMIDISIFTFRIWIFLHEKKRKKKNTCILHVQCAKDFHVLGIIYEFFVRRCINNGSRTHFIL